MNAVLSDRDLPVPRGVTLPAGVIAQFDAQGRTTPRNVAVRVGRQDYVLSIAAYGTAELR